MKLELEGYLYIKENGYDQYDVEEVCFDENIDEIKFKKSDDKKYHLNKIKYLSDILQKEMGIEISYVEYDWKNGDTFVLKPKKVRITIEEIDQ